MFFSVDCPLQSIDCLLLEFGFVSIETAVFLQGNVNRIRRVLHRIKLCLCTHGLTPNPSPEERGAPSREWHTLKEKEDFLTFTF